MTLKASLDALDHDAKTWGEVALTTLGAAQAAERLTLGEADLSWASRSTGLLDTYEEIRAKISRLLGEGASNFADMSRTLFQVSEAYQDEDSGSARRFRDLWEPK